MYDLLVWSTSKEHLQMITPYTLMKCVNCMCVFRFGYIHVGTCTCMYMYNTCYICTLHLRNNGVIKCVLIHVGMYMYNVPKIY